MERRQFHITEKLHGERFDLALVELCRGMSRRKIRQVIDTGGAYVNRKRVRISSKKLSAGDYIELQYNLQSLSAGRRQKFTFTDSNIVSCNEKFAIINKPPGLASQATRDQAVSHVIPVLQTYLRGKGIMRRPVLVHRLDRETSGLMIVAFDGPTCEQFTEMFRKKTIQKTYLALSKGIPRGRSFKIENYLSPIDKRTGKVQVVRSGGKPAITEVTLERSFQDTGICLLSCEPKTGRSHQIRVHLANRGLPIVGDKKYGDDISGLTDELLGLTKVHHFLHAHKLSFRLMGQDYQFIAPVPKSFETFLGLLY